MSAGSGWNLPETSAPLRRALAERRPVFGAWATIGDSYVAELLGRAGFDWVGIDAQHGLISGADLLHMLQALAITCTPTLVRVPWNAPELIMQTLDSGANGVIVPMIESADDARAAVAACRYPPVGSRSWGPARASLGTAGYSPEVANESVLCVVMVETVAAADGLEQILAVDGIDAVFIGPNDLALSHGFERSYDARDPRHERKILQIKDACAAAGVAAGIFAGPADSAARWAGAGFQLVAMTSDAGLISDGARELIRRATEPR